MIPDARRHDGARVGRPVRLLVVFASLAFVLHTTVAGLTGRSLETPNASTRIAERLAATGVYELAWTEETPSGTAASSLRAYVLPGEALYLAAAFRVLPLSLRRFIHVPVIVAFVTSVVAVALLVGGVRAGACAGLLALVDPFLVVHGVVWDDTILAGALVWTTLALVLWRLERAAEGVGGVGGAWLLAIAAGAGLAGATRFEAQVALLAIGAWFIIRRPASARSIGWALVAGVLVVVSAWTARNAIVVGGFLPESSHDGLALWEANHPGARGALVRGGVTQAESVLPVPPHFGEREVNEYFRHQALAYIGAHPIDAIETGALKLVVSLVGVDPSQPLLRARNAVALASSLLYLGCGTVAWILRRRWRNGLWEEWEAFTVVIVTVTVVLLTIGSVGLRYRMLLTALSYVWAGRFLVWRGGGFEQTAARRLAR